MPPAEDPGRPVAQQRLPGEEPRVSAADRRDYDVWNYIQVLQGSYVSRLKKAFAPEDFGEALTPELRQREQRLREKTGNRTSS